MSWIKHEPKIIGLSGQDHDHHTRKQGALRQNANKKMCMSKIVFIPAAWAGSYTRPSTVPQRFRTSSSALNRRGSAKYYCLEIGPGEMIPEDIRMHVAANSVHQGPMFDLACDVSGAFHRFQQSMEIQVIEISSRRHLLIPILRLWLLIRFNTKGQRSVHQKTLLSLYA